MLWSPRSLPEFLNTSTFSGIAGVKQKPKSITHLGWSGREGYCRLRPFLTTEPKQPWSLYFPLRAVFVLLCTLAKIFLISEAKEQPLISVLLLFCFQVCVRTCLSVCICLCKWENVARLLVLNLSSAENMTCSVTQQHLFVCWFVCVTHGILIRKQ